MNSYSNHFLKIFQGLETRNLRYETYDLKFAALPFQTPEMV